METEIEITYRGNDAVFRIVKQAKSRSEQAGFVLYFLKRVTTYIRRLVANG